ncbi:MAG: hypothetical protein JXB06_12100 [Spirochaetales bacterium]|nr:hypothetical protein [Spirochaetales bacterium]
MTLKCIIICTILLVMVPGLGCRLYAQEQSGSPDSTPQEETAGSGPAQNLIEITLASDIDTAGYYELVAWCREIGLDDAGTRQALQRRLYDYYEISPPAAEKEEGKQRLLEIKSAKETQYFTVEQVDEDYVLLLGDVLVEIQEEGATHRIRAHRILLNETENILSAEGGIEYTLLKGTEEEVFRGQRLTFDVDSWEGVFFSGGMEVDRTVGGETIRFRFVGESISRLEKNTVVIDRGTITSCSLEEDPHYHIRARKIWVLAPNEWAILNAILYVGRIPVLYLPFFFRPGDEFFFHPAIGFREREGSFIQTTTYLIGQKKRSSSALSFLAATEASTTQYELERRGLFLRQKTDHPVQVDENRFLKIMLDLYARLGGFAGAEGSFPKVDFKGGFAFSRTVYESQYPEWPAAAQVYFYTPWVPRVDPDEAYRSDWNRSSFFGLDLPFRFGMESDWELGSGSHRLSGKFAYFSDPSFSSDFYNRSEDAGLTRLIGLEPIQDTATEGETRNLTWELSGKIDFSDRFDTPLVKTLSFPYITANLFWQSRENTALKAATIGAAPPETYDTAPYLFYDDPSRMFYYPVSLKLPSASFRMQGDLLELTLPSIGSGKGAAGKSGQKSPGQLPADLRFPDALAGRVRPARAGTPAADAPAAGAPALRPPRIRESVPLSLQKTPLRFRLSYQVRPTVTMEQSFNADDWNEPEDVAYELKYTSLDTQGTSSLDYSLNVLENVLSWSGNFAFSGNYRSRYRQAFEDDAEWENLVSGDQQYSQLNLRTTQGLNYLPFADDPIFAKTALSYDLSWIFFRYRYNDILSTVDNPVYTGVGPDFSADTVSQHAARAALRWRMFEADSSLSLTAQLYPRQGSLSSNLQFNIWKLTTTVSSVYQDGNSDWNDGSRWILQPIVLRESLRLADEVTISEELRFDFETYREEDGGLLARSLTTVNLWNLYGSFTMDYMRPQTFDLPSESWVDASLDYDLLPSYVTLGYKAAGRERLFWKNRIRIASSLNTSWTMNIQQFTDNSLDFSLSFDFWLYKFLKLSVTTSSYNNQTFKYFRALEDREPGLFTYVNPIQDLLRSFDFFGLFGENAREESAFNLRSISVAATHYLHDWNLTLSYQGRPELDQSAQRYEWGSTFSIVLQWLPIPELRSNLQGERDVENDEFLFSLRG